MMYTVTPPRTKPTTLFSYAWKVRVPIRWSYHGQTEGSTHRIAATAQTSAMSPSLVRVLT